MTDKDILKKLKSMSDPKNAAGMARFGIRPKSKVLGAPMPLLRSLVKKIGRDHVLAQKLWRSGIHEAKILASMVDDVKMVSGAQMDKWIKGFDSWDVCDQVCLNLFFSHPLVFKKCATWADRKSEFERRAGFALMATAAFKNKQAKDGDFIKFFPLIKKYAADERNYVRKAVNWALRQIGKRNMNLNKKAISLAREIAKIDSRAARWVAADALRELRSEAVQRRLIELSSRA
ncbi:MAG: DNA alkylation repair protein [Candidatus Portnoybacteria bacterium]|nr:DNA alkylation repair protein [Candidatus Portnoybacteria bacterium]MDD4982366.1 DNA alkylation repair protein [Candidatus Portnoybacteria bacterium]